MGGFRWFVQLHAVVAVFPALNVFSGLDGLFGVFNDVLLMDAPVFGEG